MRIRTTSAVSALAVALMLTLSLPVSTAGAAEAKSSGASSEYRLGDRLPQSDRGRGQETASYKEIPWEALVPSDWDPMRVFKGIDLSRLSDGDPRAMEALERLRKEWDNAPANPAMNGARIRIPGFVVPLENHRNEVREFLLVPYFGACIHSPPPPANQIIHVFPSKPLKGVQTMDAVWVSGTLETDRSDTSMGRAGYRMKGEHVAPYKKPGRS